MRLTWSLSSVDFRDLWPRFQPGWTRCMSATCDGCWPTAEIQLSRSAVGRALEAGQPLTSQTQSQMRITCGDVNCGLTLDNSRPRGHSLNHVNWVKPRHRQHVDFSWVWWTNPDVKRHTESKNDRHCGKFTFLSGMFELSTYDFNCGL